MVAGSAHRRRPTGRFGGHQSRRLGHAYIHRQDGQATQQGPPKGIHTYIRYTCIYTHIKICIISFFSSRTGEARKVRVRVGAVLRRARDLCACVFVRLCAHAHYVCRRARDGDPGWQQTHPPIIHNPTHLVRPEGMARLHRHAGHPAVLERAHDDGRARGHHPLADGGGALLVPHLRLARGVRHVLVRLWLCVCLCVPALVSGGGCWMSMEGWRGLGGQSVSPMGEIQTSQTGHTIDRRVSTPTPSPHPHHTHTRQRQTPTPTHTGCASMILAGFIAGIFPSSPSPSPPLSVLRLLLPLPPFFPPAPALRFVPRPRAHAGSGVFSTT